MRPSGRIAADQKAGCSLRLQARVRVRGDVEAIESAAEVGFRLVVVVAVPGIIAGLDGLTALVIGIGEDFRPIAPEAFVAAGVTDVSHEDAPAIVNRLAELP